MHLYDARVGRSSSCHCMGTSRAHAEKYGKNATPTYLDTEFAENMMRSQG